MKNGKKALTAVSFLMVTNLLVKVFGLLREVLLANYYGITVYTDAYIIANNIPTVLFAAIGTSVATTFIPMYTRITEERGKQKANDFTLKFLGLLWVICIVIAILGEIFIKQVVLIFASGFREESLDITISFARVLFPSIIFMAMMNLFGAYLQVKGKIIPISLVPMFGNLTIIFALVLSSLFNQIYILVFGTLLGISIQVLFYIPWVIKTGLFHDHSKGFLRDKDTNNYLQAVFSLIIPVFLGEAVNEINSIVDRSLVSGLGTGSVSALNYAYKLINLAFGVIVASLMTILYPRLSELAAKRNMVSLKNKCEEAVIIIIGILLPITVWICIFGDSVVRVLFQHGSFDMDALKRTTNALKCYSIGLIAMGARDVLIKTFYSLQNTKIPMKNGVFCAILNIILGVVLIRTIGYRGSALATSIVAIIGAINLIIIGSKINIISIKNMLSPVVKCCVGGIVLLVWSKFMQQIFLEQFSFGITYIVALFVICAIGIFLYILSQVLLKNIVLLNCIRVLKKGCKSSV